MEREKGMTEQREIVRSADRRTGDVIDMRNDLGIGLKPGIGPG
jgi:hypothetical protein